MVVKACRTRLQPIRLLAIASDCHQLQIGQSRQVAQVRRQFVAVHDRQTDVEKGDVWRELVVNKEA